MALISSISSISSVNSSDYGISGGSYGIAIGEVAFIIGTVTKPNITNKQGNGKGKKRREKRNDVKG